MNFYFDIFVNDEEEAFYVFLRTVAYFIFYVSA
jgi:hypothetical protein